jgi:hypothetical protein
MGALISSRALASRIGTEVCRAAEEGPGVSVLGNFAFADVVCQVRVPYSGWKITPNSKGIEGTGFRQHSFKLWGLFLTDEPPRLVANVLIHHKAEELASFAWNQCQSHPGPADNKSFSSNGSDFLIYPDMLAQLRRAQGTLDILLPAPECIYAVPMAIRFALSLILNDSGGILLHSTGVVSRNKAIVFFGVSGSGKSTMARLAAADAVLSDEVVIVHQRDHKWLASGTPFHSRLGAGSNTTAELAALVKLTKAPVNRCRPLTPRIAAKELLKAAFVLDDQPRPKLQCAGNVLGAIERVPVYELEFRPERAVWPFVLKELEHLWRT